MSLTASVVAHLASPVNRRPARHDRASAAPTGQSVRQRFQLCYEPLRAGLRALCFPCNGRGEVSFADLSDRARLNYLFARACVGKLFNRPTVQADAA